VTDDAAYVIGMGLMQALAHAAPDVPAEKYPELGAALPATITCDTSNDISLFAGRAGHAGSRSRRASTC